MIKAKEARELSLCRPLSDGTLDELLKDIEIYIEKECNVKEIGLYYGVDGFKYNYATVKKAIKVLKRSGFKVLKIIDNPDKPNFPKRITLKILWWW